MTNTNRLRLSIAGFILSVITFLIFTYVPQLAGTETANFCQGFAGGIALGTFLGMINYSREVRRERA